MKHFPAGLTSSTLRLAENIHTIARHASAADCYNDIKRLIEAIDRCINRPDPPRYCGNCPTATQDKNNPNITKQCSVALYAKHAEIEVRCWNCHHTHNIEKLITKQLRANEHTIFNQADMLEIMTQIGEPIGESTWRRWRATGRIKPVGELYGQPAYKLSDVRRIRRDTPQCAKVSGN